MKNREATTEDQRQPKWDAAAKAKIDVSNSDIAESRDVDFKMTERILYSVVVYYAVQALVIIVTNWAKWDFKTKLFSLECLNYALFLLLLTSEHFGGFFGNRATLNALISPESNENEETDIKSSRKQQMLDEMNKEGMSFLIMAGHSTKCLYISYSFNSIHGMLTYLTGNNQEIEELPKPCIIEIPFQYIAPQQDTILHYVLVSVLHCLYLYICYYITATIYVFCVTGYTAVAVELKMFLVRLKELDEMYLRKILNLDERGHEFVDSNFQDVIGNRVKMLVMDHQRIFRKMNQLSKGNAYMIFYVNAFVCIQICLAIISFQNGAISDKLKCSFRGASIIAFCYVYSEYGQGIQEEFENVRIAMYDLCGYGKPVWIQKTFLILMIRNTHIPQLSFYKTFTNERRNLANVTRAAYSYFNLLNQRNKLLNHN
ncbi:uncharacterized protein LOC120352666 [Nilaparvata lugens]|uniref:uncharacterized protein LOC120352666 n=1 Tax=Nilaparvata lugens TaxID=108931 RepID=UPI00193DDC2C|nr:uncharacterized protein LOC120352666 [Nilaparvata lugens]